MGLGPPWDLGDVDKRSHAYVCFLDFNQHAGKGRVDVGEGSRRTPYPGSIRDWVQPVPYCPVLRLGSKGLVAGRRQKNRGALTQNSVTPECVWLAQSAPSRKYPWIVNLGREH